MLVIRYMVPSALMKRPSIVQNALVKIPYPSSLPSVIKKQETELIKHKPSVTSIVKVTQTPVYNLFATLHHLEKEKK